MALRRKAPKDLNAPKKPQTSYFLYSNERRPILREQNKDIKLTEISKLIAQEWKSLNDDIKKQYTEKAKLNKEKYNEEMIKYKETDNYRNFQIKLNEWKENEKNRKNSIKKSGKLSKIKKPIKPKKPLNMPKKSQTGYFIFTNKRRPELKAQYNDKKITEISKLIGKEWSEMSEDEKKNYNEQANLLKEEYNKLIEEYKKTDEYKNYINKLNEYKKELKKFNNAAMDIDNESDNENGNNAAGVFKFKGKKVPKKPKDELCPKKPLSAFFIYSSEQRPILNNDNTIENKKSSVIQKIIGEKWKSLSDEEKLPYQEKAKVLKEEYNIKFNEYKNSEEYKIFNEKIDNWKNECKKIKKENEINRAKAKAEFNAKYGNNNNNNSNGNNNKKISNKRKKKYESDSDDSDDSSSSDSDSESSSDSSDSSDDDDSSSESDSISTSSE